MKLFGLIGYPLGHSFSKNYFTEKFEREQIDARYDLYEIRDVSALSDIVNNQELAGLNVTIPYKEQVIPLLDEMDDLAAEIGAVNVIKITHENGNHRLKGYNSDIYGFIHSIRPLLKTHHTRALILGTGGASKAVFFGLKQLNIEADYVSRTPKKGCFTYNELTEEVMRNHSVIINSSPAGTFPTIDEAPAIPYHLVTEKHILYDLVYNPPLTRFLAFGQAQGATIKNGQEMLEEQAKKAWQIWME